MNYSSILIPYPHSYTTSTTVQFSYHILIHILHELQFNSHTISSFLYYMIYPTNVLTCCLSVMVSSLCPVSSFISMGTGDVDDRAAVTNDSTYICKKLFQGY